ncbi:MAG: two-component system, sensor histidine kinase and response regulator [Abditibacteriota bacterium]|nr:two-component system, sensor histidine kinase and response regulator [Abditibacteriota bacterium]
MAEAVLSTSMHILFADDVSDTRHLYGLALHMAGHTVRIVSNGIEAVAAVNKEAFDAIVLDVQMPNMNGWEALHRIRTLPNGVDVPIALFSASMESSEVESARERGADTLIFKPVMPDVMLMVLQELVDQKQRANPDATIPPRRKNAVHRRAP